MQKRAVLGLALSGLALGAVAGFTATPANAADAKFERQLKLLMPADRMAQLCDYTAMTAIRKEHSEFRPDRAVANAVVEIATKGDTMLAAGGAFRSKGKWYAMSYSCKTDSERLKVLSFSYKVGGEIPQEKWAGYGLWQ